MLRDEEEFISSVSIVSRAFGKAVLFNPVTGTLVLPKLVLFKIQNANLANRKEGRNVGSAQFLESSKWGR